MSTVSVLNCHSNHDGMPYEIEGQGLRELGSEVRALRKEAGLTLRGAAEVAGLKYTYVGQVETGKRCPTLHSLESIALAIGAELRVSVVSRDAAQAVESLPAGRKALMGRIVAALSAAPEDAVQHFEGAVQFLEHFTQQALDAG